jgi:hypothetical protein
MRANKSKVGVKAEEPAGLRRNLLASHNLS